MFGLSDGYLRRAFNFMAVLTQLDTPLKGSPDQQIHQGSCLQGPIYDISGAIFFNIVVEICKTRVEVDWWKHAVIVAKNTLYYSHHMTILQSFRVKCNLTLHCKPCEASASISALEKEVAADWSSSHSARRVYFFSSTCLHLIDMPLPVFLCVCVCVPA